MGKRVLPSGLTLILATPVMAAGLVALAVALRPCEERLLIEHWQETIDALADEEVSVVCGQLAGSGEMGVRVLAGQLGSDRNAVSLAVHSALRSAIDEWQEDALHDASSQFALVARVLAKSVDAYNPAARSRAADVAHRILLWSPDGNAADRSAIVTDCQKILSLAQAGPARLAAVRGDGVTLPKGPTFGSAWSPADMGAQVPRRDVLDRHVHRADHVGSRSGPTSVRVAPPFPPRPDPFGIDGSSAHRSTAGVVAEAPGGAPRLLLEPIGVRPIPLPSRRDNASNRPAIAVGPGSEAGEAATSVASRRPTAVTDGALDRLPAIDVMRLLHNAAPETVTAAEAELHDRGLTATHVCLARQLTDPDPSVRSRLIDRLPELPGCDSRPWLYWLSADGHADVRLAALTVMATSGDPDFLRRVETVARRDRDPRIAALAERVRANRR